MVWGEYVREELEDGDIGNWYEVMLSFVARDVPPEIVSWVEEEIGVAEYFVENSVWYDGEEVGVSARGWWI